MKNEIAVMELKLKAIKEEVEKLKPLAEKIRSHYKHQNAEADSASEDFILSFERLSDIEHCLDFLRELEAYETQE